MESAGSGRRTVAPDVLKTLRELLGPNLFRIYERGQCFRTAYWILDFIKTRGDGTTHDYTAELVHGTPLYQGTDPLAVGKLIGHAWVEVDTPEGIQCIDVLSGPGSIPELVFLPQRIYYIAGAMKEEHMIRIPWEEALRLSNEKETYGPWETLPGDPVMVD